jgi:hypothetical protein
VSRKKKFDLTHLVHNGSLANGQELFYVSDPTKTCIVAKQPNGEFKVTVKTETMTIFSFVQKCLNQEPPDHASRWLRTTEGKTLYELWHADEDLSDAA